MARGRSSPRTAKNADLLDSLKMLGLNLDPFCLLLFASISATSLWSVDNSTGFLSLKPYTAGILYLTDSLSCFMHIFYPPSWLPRLICLKEVAWYRVTKSSRQNSLIGLKAVRSEQREKDQKQTRVPSKTNGSFIKEKV